MSYEAKAVANYFLERAKLDGQPVDAMKLQKLVYFAHGWYLALTRQPLIKQRIEAWTYGPVVPDIYHEFKRFGSKPITELATLDDPRYIFSAESAPPYKLPSGDEDPIADSLRGFLSQIYTNYIGFSGPDLSAMTHVKDGPWAGTVNRGRNVCIDDSVIRDYFVKCREEGRAF